MLFLKPLYISLCLPPTSPSCSCVAALKLLILLYKRLLNSFSPLQPCTRSQDRPPDDWGDYIGCLPERVATAVPLVRPWRWKWFVITLKVNRKQWTLSHCSPYPSTRPGTKLVQITSAEIQCTSSLCFPAFQLHRVSYHWFQIAHSTGLPPLLHIRITWSSWKKRKNTFMSRPSSRSVKFRTLGNMACTLLHTWQVTVAMLV